MSGGKVKIVVKGKIKVPAGVNAKAACTGTVLLTIKKGKKLLTARNAKLGKTCTFSKTIEPREEQGRQREEARRSRCASRATRCSSPRRRT